MTKHLKHSKRKVTVALNTFNKTIDKLLEANKILESGVVSAKLNYDNTDKEIVNLKSKLNEYNLSIIKLEDEIEKNLTLISKFKDLTKL